MQRTWQVEFLETEDKTKPVGHQCSKSVEIKGGVSIENPTSKAKRPEERKAIILIKPHGEQGLPSKHGSKKKENISGSVSEVKQKRRQRREDENNDGEKEPHLHFKLTCETHRIAEDKAGRSHVSCVCRAIIQHIM